MKKYADIVFVNGEVVTVNREDKIEQSLAISENKIVYVGTNEDIRNFIDDNTEIIDLHGRSLLPGFIDAHTHFVDGAIVTKLDIDCSYPNVKSIEDIKNLIKDASDKVSEGGLIVASRYNHYDLIEGRHPTRFDLDEAAPNHRVALIRVCGHMGVFNSKCLDAFGITDEVEGVNKQEVDKKNGQLTGLILESTFYKYSNYLLRSIDQMIESIIKVDKEFSEVGITSIHEAGGYGASQMKALQIATDKKMIKTRVYAMLTSFYTDNKVFLDQCLGTGFYTGFGNERLKLGCTKVMVDGASSVPTAAVREPYTSNPNDSGILCYSQEDLDEYCLRAHLEGVQLTAHAVGDKAIEMMINAIEKALIKSPREDHRHRIEHAAVLAPDLIARIKDLGIIPVPQPIFVQDYGDCYITHYGSERCRYIFPVKSFINEGIIAAASSDWCVSTYNPMMGLHVAVNRETKNGVIFTPEERLSILEAIRIYTINGAYASLEENIKGSLEVGKLADLVVLSEAITKCDHNKIKDIKVDMTVIDGEIVYKRS